MRVEQRVECISIIQITEQHECDDGGNRYFVRPKIEHQIEGCDFKRDEDGQEDVEVQARTEAKSFVNKSVRETDLQIP